MRRADINVRRCGRCGRVRNVSLGRTISAVCVDCRTLPFTMTRPEDGVSGGRWVRDGLVWKFVPWRCPCGEQLEHEHDDCPTCRPWAERDAVKASWRRPWAA